MAERTFRNPVIPGFYPDPSIYYAAESEAWQPVAENVDGRVLSTQVAGGFVGAMIGMYASSNGQPRASVADFDWFEYVGLDQR